MYFTCKSPVTRLIYCQPLKGTGTRDNNSLKVVWFDRSWFRESLEAIQNLNLVPKAFELPRLSKQAEIGPDRLSGVTDAFKKRIVHRKT
jgi:hypothetical protein